MTHAPMRTPLHPVYAVCVHSPVNLPVCKSNTHPPACTLQLEQRFSAPQHTVDPATVTAVHHPPPGTPLPKDMTFPLIIRMEALTDEGRAQSKSLEEVPVGGELPPWVQSQTTYAWVEKDGEEWVARVVKQKLWVKGEQYELQEIYGMEQSRAPAVGMPAVEGFEDIDGNECVICMSAPRDTAALPCRHMCMCHGCASALKTQVCGQRVC